MKTIQQTDKKQRTKPARPRSPVKEEVEAQSSLLSFQEFAIAQSANVPDEVWDRLPHDGAHQHDHYLYGTAKTSK